MPMKHLLTLLLATALLPACDYDTFRDSAPEPVPEPVSNAPISLLRQHYYDRSVRITEPIVFSGIVTSSDRAGNFYRTLVVEDESGAVEIRAGLYDLHNLFPTGHRVEIAAQGMVTGYRLGVMQLGRAGDDWSARPCDYFLHRPQLEAHLRCSLHAEPFEAAEISLAELKEELCGRLVTVRGVASDAAPRACWAPAPDQADNYSYNGYRLFRDGNGDSITVITSSYASFAGHPVPEGRLSLTGILLYGSDDSGRKTFLLKLRDENDVRKD